MTESLRDAICAIDGVIESSSQFKDDLAYWVNGQEIAHFEAPDGIDIRLTRGVIREHRDELSADSRVTLRRAGSDWVEMLVRDAGDHDAVIRLVALAAQAHGAPDGVTPMPPPTASDLERRRRFH